MRKNNIIPTIILMMGIILVELSRNIEWLSKILNIVGTIILAIGVIAIMIAIIQQIRKKRK